MGLKRACSHGANIATAEQYFKILYDIVAVFIAV